jgi:hypothetical protein
LVTFSPWFNTAIGCFCISLLTSSLYLYSFCQRMVKLYVVADFVIITCKELPVSFAKELLIFCFCFYVRVFWCMNWKTRFWQATGTSLMISHLIKIVLDWFFGF